jgi:hypothetical protein
MLIARRRVLAFLPLPVLATACGISESMPAFRQAAPLTAAQSNPSEIKLPPRQSYAHRLPIRLTYDSTTNQTRVSLTTHKGKHFLGTQHPRVTFFYDFAGTIPSGVPASISLVFRTTDPELAATNRLSTLCDNTRSTQPIVPTFWPQSGAMVSSSNYTYEIPLQTFADLLRCNSLTLDVGGISAAFKPEQMNALRDFASRMAPE